MTTNARWYVRGTEASHDYEDAVGRSALCIKCGIIHARPLGKAWHLEGDSVDKMVCGVKIDLDDGEVRDEAPRLVCEDCLSAYVEEEDQV